MRFDWQVVVFGLLPLCGRSQLKQLLQALRTTVGVALAAKQAARFFGLAQFVGGSEARDGVHAF
ncbi:MAG: hypothetical protein K0R45_3301 [Pseudomonas sp.]|nr:hypothetical protein [Pseudomonas sp.]